jgi:hypothetical protein
MNRVGGEMRTSDEDRNAPVAGAFDLVLLGVGQGEAQQYLGV